MADNILIFPMGDSRWADVIKSSTVRATVGMPDAVNFVGSWEGREAGYTWRNSSSEGLKTLGCLAGSTPSIAMTKWRTKPLGSIDKIVVDLEVGRYSLNDMPMAVVVNATGLDGSGKATFLGEHSNDNFARSSSMSATYQNSDFGSATTKIAWFTFEIPADWAGYYISVAVGPVGFVSGDKAYLDYAYDGPATVRVRSLTAERAGALSGTGLKVLQGGRLRDIGPYLAGPKLVPIALDISSAASIADIVGSPSVECRLAVFTPLYLEARLANNMYLPGNDSSHFACAIHTTSTVDMFTGDDASEWRPFTAEAMRWSTANGQWNKTFRAGPFINIINISPGIRGMKLYTDYTIPFANIQGLWGSTRVQAIGQHLVIPC